MPPVRWKLWAVAAAHLLSAVFLTRAQTGQDQITADGWRPIVGSRKSHLYESFTPKPNDFYKYEAFSPTPHSVARNSVGTGGQSRPQFMDPSKPPLVISAKPPFVAPSMPPFRASPMPLLIPVRKIPHQKPNPYFALPTHETHGPHIPLGAVVHTRQSQIGHIKPARTAVTSKPSAQASPTIKRAVIQPLRHPIAGTTDGHKNEIFAASATSGYSLHQKGPSNIRTRETIELGLPAAGHYPPIQPHLSTRLEYSGRFSVPPNTESVYEQYNPQVTRLVFDKHPQSNDISFHFAAQNDEFTRTLIPPPHVYSNKEIASRIKDASFVGKPNINENVVLQVPPLFQQPPQKAAGPQVQVQVTKEKLREFHNNIPDYHGQLLHYDLSGARNPPTEAPKHVYEVTEAKPWEEPLTVGPTQARKATSTQPKKQRLPESANVPAFLPTPYAPEAASSVEPTSPTQSEVSTIFTKLSKIQREKTSTTPGPFDYNVKEVSTHYPILGKPFFGNPYLPTEFSNDVTTYQEDAVTTTQRARPHRRRRPESKRTTTTTTTTEEPVRYIEYDSQKTEEEKDTSEAVNAERPTRRRRPQRYRTTTPAASSEEAPTKLSRGRNRYRHRNTEIIDYQPVKKRQRPSWIETTATSEEYTQNSSESEEVEDPARAETIELELPGRHYPSNQFDVSTKTPEEEGREETIKPFVVMTTTQKPPTNEADVTSVSNTELATTTGATPSQARIKNRPFKFDNSNRPRFSVKDYRQKLSQYSTTSTPHTPRTTSEAPKIRLPSRIRRPSTTTSSSTEEETETARPRFVPKEPRHSTTESTNAAIITENNVKSVNPRLRPFGRYKSTTASTTTTPKVSIKPNLFSRKRPPMLSLRSKIYNKYHRNATESSTEKTTIEEDEIKPTTESAEEEQEPESTSAITSVIIDKPTVERLELDTTTVRDFSKIDPAYYSQRVSDLTSSSDYDTPGLFKAVSPTSRRIPSYFTISTDDPILPIEAFFSNINDKMKDRKSAR